MSIDVDAERKKFATYHEVNGLKPTADRWRGWLAVSQAREVRVLRARQAELRAEIRRELFHLALFVLIAGGVCLALWGAGNP